MNERAGEGRSGNRARRSPRPSRSPSWPFLLVPAILVALSFLQRVGRTTFDTKFDLTADPGRLLGRSTDLWVSGVDLGGLANQGYGYLFPQGTFFLLGDLLALPDWITQRAWSALVLVVAYEGARRLARAMGIGAGSGAGPATETFWIPVLVGTAYALSPRLVGLSGSLSAEMLPSAVLPWVCLPLVLALDGRLPVRRAGVLAGLAVLAMGGVNATENLLALPLALFLVLSGLRTRPGRRLAAWWVACTTLASLWWMLPLLLLGRYSPPFLDYIETAANTTRTTGWSNTVRGTEHWLNYVDVGGGPFFSAAHTMSSAVVLVLLGGVISAVGVAGLARTGPHSLRFRVPLLLTFAVGALVATAGHGGLAGTPLAGGLGDLLDGALAPFRNVHKADPSIRLPLVLGFGAGCSALGGWLTRHHRARFAPSRLRLVAVGVLVLASAAPVFTNSLRHPGWDRIPPSWQQAATWLDHDGPGATLVVPATGFGQQTWGWTVDEPVQGLLSSGWVARTQIPLIPAASIRLLDGIDARVESGLGSASLAPTLAASGITRILLRNDLDPSTADATDAVRVATALAASPGIAKVRSFGAAGLPDLEVYRVTGTRAQPEATATDGLQVLTGAPEDVLAAREAGLVAAGEHVLVGRSRSGAPDIVTDGYRLVERDFGRTHDAVSDVRAPGEPSRTHRKVADYAGAPGVPRVYAGYPDLDSVTASTSAGYASSVGPVRPEFGPAAVGDDDPSTSWRSAPFTRARGQHVDLNLNARRPIGTVTVLAGAGGNLGVRITRLAITAGTVRTVVTPDAEGRASVDLGGVLAGRVRVTVLSVADNRRLVQVAIRDIAVAGLDTSRTLVVPDVGADASTSFVLDAGAPRRPCLYGALGTTCDPGYARPGPERGRLDRTVTVHGGGDWELSGSVVAQPSAATARLLLPVGRRGLVPTSTSVLGEDPAVSAVFATDGQKETSWLAAYGDRAPVLDLRWDRPRTLRRLQVVASAVPALSPYEAVIRAGGQTRTVQLGAGDLGYFEPISGVRAASITLRARAAAGQRKLAVGVGEITLDGLAALSRPVPLAWAFSSPCGLGPDLRLGGQRYRTTVSGTLGDIVAGRPLTWRSCAGDVRMAAGTQRVQVTATPIFAPVQVVLRSTRPDRGAATARPVTDVTGSAPSMRLVVADGPEAVLVFGQNANPGWRATLAGRTLPGKVVDGWQQGFVLPPGTGGEVRIDFAGQRVNQLALGIGGLGALALVILLLLDLRRPCGVTDAVTAGPASRRPVVLGGALGLVVLSTLGGPAVAAAALIGAGLTSIGRRRWLPVAAGLLVFVSAEVAAFTSGTAVGVPGDLADLVAALGCGLVIGTLVAVREVGDAPT